MLRNILLGLLALGIIPITLADATAISNTKVLVPQETKKLNQKLDTVFSCNTLERSPDCISDTDVDDFEIHSQLWLNNITDILLSGSMFRRCRNRVKFANNSAVASEQTPRKSLVSGCIFGWQQPYQQKLDSKAIATLPESIAAESPTQSEIFEDERQEFPKLSRSSLIVSLPTADNTFTPINTKLANPAPETTRIASPFGWRTRPYSYQLQFHQGIDYGAPLGSPVVAVGDGIVTRVVSGCYDFGNLYCGGQLGNRIAIDHGNGRMGTYGHLKNSSITVKEGMKVWRNQEIAQVGSSGWSTGAHLDFRLKVNGEYEDPLKYLTSPKLAKEL